jgi:hypothetical protein
MCGAQPEINVSAPIAHLQNSASVTTHVRTLERVTSQTFVKFQRNHPNVCEVADKGEY